MKIFVFVLILLVAFATELCGQNLMKDFEVASLITYTDRDTIYNFRVVTKEIESPIDADYYWFQAGVLHHTEGGFTGKLVHGNFEKFNRAHLLLEKGVFHYGIKTGTWLTWYPNGKLKSNCQWKDSKRHGAFKEFFENGAVKRIGTFKRGKLHGSVQEFAKEGKQLKKVSYRNGVIKVKKQRPKKSVEDSVKKKKRIFFKKRTDKSAPAVQQSGTNETDSVPPKKRVRKKKEKLLDKEKKS